jgi:hypothetical protein
MVGLASPAVPVGTEDVAGARVAVAASEGSAVVEGVVGIVVATAVPLGDEVEGVPSPLSQAASVVDIMRRKRIPTAFMGVLSLWAAIALLMGGLLPCF